jgi:hypothetical protein
MRRLLLASALLGLAVAAPAPDRAAAQGQRDPSASLGLADVDRSRTAFVYMPAEGEMRVQYNAKWQTAIIIFLPSADGKSWQESWRSTDMKSTTTRAGVSPHIVTAWARRSDKGPNEPWRQSQYEIKGIDGGFRIGFNDGREPKFDDAIVEFVWGGRPGVVGSIVPGAGSSSAQQSGAAAPAPAPAASPGRGPLGLPLPGDSPEKGAR